MSVFKTGITASSTCALQRSSSLSQLDWLVKEPLLSLATTSSYEVQLATTTTVAGWVFSERALTPQPPSLKSLERNIDTLTGRETTTSEQTNPSIDPDETLALPEVPPLLDDERIVSFSDLPNLDAHFLPYVPIEEQKAVKDSESTPPLPVAISQNNVATTPEVPPCQEICLKPDLKREKRKYTRKLLMKTEYITCRREPIDEHTANFLRKILDKSKIKNTPVVVLTKHSRVGFGIIWDKNLLELIKAVVKKIYPKGLLSNKASLGDRPNLVKKLNNLRLSYSYPKKASFPDPESYELFTDSIVSNVLTQLKRK